MKRINSAAMIIAIVALIIYATHGSLMAQSTSGPFDGRWSATVGPQGSCNFTSILVLEVVGSSIVGNATNPSGAFSLSGTVDLSGNGVLKIGTFAGTITFSGTTFKANYANRCGPRFAIGTKQVLTVAPQSQPQVPAATALRCDAAAIAQRIKAANPGADPAAVGQAVIYDLIMLGCRDQVPPAFLAAPQTTECQWEPGGFGPVWKCTTR